MTTWNYRIATKVTQANNSSLPWREFLIIECYYKNGTPDGYIEKDILSGWSEVEDLVSTLDLIIDAKTRPVLDLDNWPNEWYKNKKHASKI